MDKVCLFLVLVIPLAINALADTDVHQNSISEDDRRGSTLGHQTDDGKNDETGKKSTRFIHSATAKHQNFFYPSGLDAHVAATGGAAGYGSTSGSGSDYGHSAPSNLGGHHHHSTPHHGHTDYATGYGGHGFGHSGHHGYGLYSPGSHGYGGVHALKGLLIPLAGIAILGAAAALTTNPVLLQLGVVNGRRRRSLPTSEIQSSYPTNPYVRPQRAN